MVGQVAQFGGADEGEVGRVEEHHRPFAFEVLVGDGDEFAVLVGIGFERLDGGVDECHGDFLSVVSGLIDKFNGL
jgi:hypothetical protein